MPLILHMFNPSPPVRAVLMTVEVLGLEVGMKQVSTLNKDQYKPEFLKKNPLHTIPVLEDGDFIVADSHAIITYLVSKYGADSRAELYPSDVQAKAYVDQRLFFDTSHLFPKIYKAAMEIMLNKASGVTEKLKSDIREVYGFVEKYLEKTTFVAGDHLTLADISCVASISSLNALVPVPEELTKVHAWWAKLSNESWYQKANVPGLIELSQLFKTMMEKNAS